MDDFPELPTSTKAKKKTAPDQDEEKPKNPWNDRPSFFQSYHTTENKQNVEESPSVHTYTTANDTSKGAIPKRNSPFYPSFTHTEGTEKGNAFQKGSREQGTHTKRRNNRAKHEIEKIKQTPKSRFKESYRISGPKEYERNAFIERRTNDTRKNTFQSEQNEIGFRETTECKSSTNRKTTGRDGDHPTR